MAKLWSFEKSKVSRRTLFRGAVAVVAAGVGAKWLADKLAMPEAPSTTAAQGPAGYGEATEAGTFINVRDFKQTLTVEELCRTSEQYFAVLDNHDYLLAKPLSEVEGAPDLLNNFAHVLHALGLVPGMTVLDFGAGSCWASRWLTQLGMEVVALDVSATALKIGQELYTRQPVIGDKPRPRFLTFDGHRIELPDASVDRIICLDTFHHLLNPDEVLREMSRILKPGGIAGFSEPGPHHSRSPQSQYEMRNFRVLEDDIHIDDIWAAARKAGFVRVQLAVFSPRAYMLNLPEFEDYLNGGKANEGFAAMTRAQMHDRRVFFLHNGGQPAPLDSRSRAGLAAKLNVSLQSVSVKQGAPLTGEATVTNSGRAIWLPRSRKPGGVQLGCHLLDPSGKMLNIDFFRQPLTPGDGRPVNPGETLKIDVRLPPLPKGSYILEFDLVSESVVWFAMNGSQIVRVKLDVT